MKKILGSLLTATILFAAPTAQEVANQLKALQGETLKNPVVFVKYGKDIFDWLAVTTDGKFAAKLNGLNPDGSFNYTILGDPAKYGLKLDVSLDGVKIVSAASSNQSSAQAKIKTANTAITTVITGIAPEFAQSLTAIGGFNATRDLQEPSLTSLTLTTLQHLANKQNNLREFEQEKCPGGGTITASGNYSQAVAQFNQCVTNGFTINGTIRFSLNDNYYSATYQNISVYSNEYSYTLPSGTLHLTLDEYWQVQSYDLQLESSMFEDKTKHVTYYFKNLHQTIQLQNKIITASTNTQFKASCQNEWLTIRTISPFQIPQGYNSCPVAGILTAKNSHDDIKVVCNQDTSIDVIDNQSGQKIEHYPNCHAIPSNDICAE